MIRAQTARVKPNREKKQNRNILRKAPGPESALSGPGAGGGGGRSPRTPHAPARGIRGNLWPPVSRAGFFQRCERF